MLDRSLADNLTATAYAPLSRFGFISHRRQMQTARDWMRHLDVRAQSPNQRISELSGGNQQKVALGRLLHHNAKILLLDEPTRGIDVGAKEEVFEFVGEMVAEGVGILIVSSEMVELLGICDRILVMHEQRIVGELSRAEATEERIAFLSAGGGQALVA